MKISNVKPSSIDDKNQPGREETNTSCSWLPSLSHLCHRQWDKDLQPGQVWGGHLVSSLRRRRIRWGVRVMESDPGKAVIFSKTEGKLRPLGEWSSKSCAKVKPSRRWILSCWVQSSTKGLWWRGRAVLPGHGVLVGQLDRPVQFWGTTSVGSVTKGSSSMEWPWQPHPGHGSLTLESPRQRSEPWSLSTELRSIIFSLEVTCLSSVSILALACSRDKVEITSQVPEVCTRGPSSKWIIHLIHLAL